MIPIENTIAGRVADIHHLLPESRCTSSANISCRPFPPDGAAGHEAIAEIKTVHSHIHALGQCRKYIRKNGWKPMVAGDTAGAAKLVSEKGDGTMAALRRRSPRSSIISICSRNMSRTRNPTSPVSSC
jgi:prephenate dehydratase